MISFLNAAATGEGDGAAPGTGRRKVRRASTCEALEGRQLLNGSWGGGMGWGRTDAAPISAADAAGGPAQFRSIGGQDGPRLDASSGPMSFRVAPGQSSGGPASTAGTAPGDPAAAGTTTAAGTDATAADMQAWRTLRIDSEALKGMVPATLQASIKSDVAIIDKALLTLGQAKDATTTGGSSASSADGSSATTDGSAATTTADGSATTTATADGSATATATTTDALTKLTTLLQEAQVSDGVISGIKADIQSYQSAIASADATLLNKITSERAALISGLSTDQQAAMTKYGAGLDGLGGNLGINLDADAATRVTVAPTNTQGGPADTARARPIFTMDHQGAVPVATTVQATPIAAGQGDATVTTSAQATPVAAGQGAVPVATTAQATPVASGQAGATLATSDAGATGPMADASGQGGPGMSARGRRVHGGSGMTAASDVARAGGGRLARASSNNTGGPGSFGRFHGGRGFGRSGR
ncbi:hypothetical protein OJF2_36630 [Aquisphaera giovannonii]|uniref:Uncharacterized protein n=1 Tax=Aquisphaera giovannonii TaxID=406548 RepID=A0A5B9W3E9_9BACT|nr:hypothetical protein [Aquisphaera giovannonii]QEH35118.1 hypothetical protein OJF2_36630 [Aquisphaera giovannonii]